MPTSIVVVAEAEADFRHATCLADRAVLEKAPEWLDRDQLDFERTWAGLEPNSRFTKWCDIREIAKKHTKTGFGRLLGFGSGSSGGYDYATTRKVLSLCATMHSRPDALLLVRDLDHQAKERKASIGRATSADGMTVILALPNPKREAWALNGFLEKPHETQRLASLHQELGFHPCLRAEELTAQTQGAKRDAKTGSQ